MTNVEAGTEPQSEFKHTNFVLLTHWPSVFSLHNALSSLVLPQCPMIFTDVEEVCRFSVLIKIIIPVFLTFHMIYPSRQSTHHKPHPDSPRTLTPLTNSNNQSYSPDSANT